MATKGRKLTERGALAGMLAVAPLATLGAADDAEAKKIAVKNTKSRGQGSFNRAVNIAERTKQKDTILFQSSLSGSIPTRGEVFKKSVALKSKSNSVKLVGRGEDPDLYFASEDTISRSAKPNAMRGLRLDGVRVATGSYVDLTISNSTITGDGPEGNERPLDPEESGVYTYFGHVKVKRSTISGWESGVSNYQTSIKITDSVISGNYRGTSNGKGSTEIKRSTITGNEAYGVRSGYYGFTSISNSTLSGNDGYAVYGDASAENTTIAENGGVSFGYAGYGLAVENSVVARNAHGGEPQCTGPALESRGANVFSGVADCTPPNPKDDDVFTDRPGLRPLKDNGGPTPTMALRANSPAVDHANGDATETDQRGVRRRAFPDSGAYERVLCGGKRVNVVGTRRSDKLRGGPGDDSILAAGGPDRVKGGGGNDAICGGAGKDKLKGARGNDLLRGGRGKDRCSGGRGNDKAVGCKTERGIER